MIVCHPLFEGAVCAVLIVNVLTIGWETESMAKSRSTQTYLGQVVLNWLFCLFFVAEISLRLFVHGQSFFLVRSWRWNTFELLVVAMQVVEEVLSTVDFIVGRNQAIGASLKVNAPGLRLLRMMRLVKLLRFGRLIRMFKELHTLAISFAASLKTFFWTMVLLMLILYVAGVFFTQLVAYYSDDLPDAEEATAVNLHSYWGSLFRSILSSMQLCQVELTGRMRSGRCSVCWDPGSPLSSQCTSRSPRWSFSIS